MGLLAHESPNVVLLTLRLIHNLAFDGDFRAALMRLDAPKRLAPFIGTPIRAVTLTWCESPPTQTGFSATDDADQGSVALRVLYLLSTDDKNRAVIAASGCLPSVSTSALSPISQRKQ